MGRTTYEVARPNMRPSANGPTRYVLTSNPDRYASQSVPGGFEFVADAPQELMERIGGQTDGTVVVAGGAAVYARFAAAGLVDEWHITIEPVLFGRGKPLLSSEVLQQLEIVERRLINDSTLFLRYVPRRFSEGQPDRILSP